MSSEEDIYEIGAVLKDRKKRGQIEYLIRWKNFDAEEDSWEPASNLTSAIPLLEEYRKNKSVRRRSKSRSRSRSRTRTKLPQKKDTGTPEKTSLESTPIIAPPEEKSLAPVENLETLPPSDDVTKEITEDSTTQLEDVDSQSVVTELSNDGVEQTPVTSFTSTRVTTETTDVYTPISESITTVLTRRIKMRAAAKAAEIEEEEKSDVEDDEPEKKDVDSVDSVEPVIETKEEECIASDTATSIGNRPEKTWPIVVCIVGLVIVAVSFLLGKFLVK